MLKDFEVVGERENSQMNMCFLNNAAVTSRAKDVLLKYILAYICNQLDLPVGKLACEKKGIA